MKPDRPATGFWARAEQERRALLAEFAQRARHRMLDAGGITAGDLSPQTQRILGWLAETDQPTIDGVADLLRATHHAGLTAAVDTQQPERTAPAAIMARLDAIARRADEPGVEL